MQSEGTWQQVERCTKCGNHQGWYEKRVCKYIQFFEANGDAFDAGNMERVRGGERRFCIGCNRDITDQIKKVAR